MRVLITNATLEARTGTETFVRDLALGLLARGHQVAVYAPRLGPLARELHDLTVPVVDDLDRIGEPPDIIHGHHLHEAVAALLRFPGVPGIFVVHDWHAWHDQPPAFPRILRYVAVDQTRRDRLVLESGVPVSQVAVIPNGVDLARFRPRGPLPDRPGRALVFSSYVTQASQLRDLRAACRRRGLRLEAAGSGLGRTLARPELHLPAYDLVFALGRSALEAMATGAAVVVWGLEGLGGFVDRASFGPLLARNFGRRALAPAGVDALEAAIARYDPAEAQAVRDRVRRDLSLDGMVEAYLALYGEVLAEAATRTFPPEEDLEAARRYLEACVPRTQVLGLLQGRAARGARRLRRAVDVAWLLASGGLVAFAWRLLLLMRGAHGGLRVGVALVTLVLLGVVARWRTIARARSAQWSLSGWLRAFRLA